MNDLSIILDSFKSRLIKAVNRSNEGWTWEKLVDGVVNTGKLGFFHNVDSCAVLQMCTSPKGVYLHILFAAGNQDGLYSLYEDVATWARENGCYKMTTLARKGFVKRLPKMGWRQPYAFFERDL